MMCGTLSGPAAPWMGADPNGAPWSVEKDSSRLSFRGPVRVRAPGCPRCVKVPSRIDPDVTVDHHADSDIVPASPTATGWTSRSAVVEE